MPAISIIVPVYNVENYLTLCIDSILSQSFQDFELVLVDDGSKDSSGMICDEYEKLYKKVHVIHQANKGVSAARNAGIQIAQGKYMICVDSDDTLDPEMLGTMVSIAETGNYDLVVCGMEYYDEAGNLLYQNLKSDLELNQQQIMESMFAMPDPLGGIVYNKLFLRKKIENIRFNESATMAEDRMYLFDAYQCLNSCRKIPEAFYKVLNRQDSATHSTSCIRIYEFFKNNYQVLKKTKNYSSLLESKAIDKYLDDCLRYIPEIKKELKEEDPDGKLVLKKSKLLMIRVLLKAAFQRKLTLKKIYVYTMALITNFR